MIPSGIEPATFRFVAKYLNHCATISGPLSTATKPSNILHLVFIHHWYSNPELPLQVPASDTAKSNFRSYGLLERQNTGTDICPNVAQDLCPSCCTACIRFFSSQVGLLWPRFSSYRAAHRVNDGNFPKLIQV
jgi:hypothetical protein